MLHSRLIARTASYVRNMMNEKLPATRLFHDISHTEEVVYHCQLLMDHYDLPEERQKALIVAAWFHDVGYCVSAVNHEEESVKIAAGFLNESGVPVSFTREVEQLILVTKLPANPLTLSQQILCDADLHHLGSAGYRLRAILLRKELEQHNGLSITNSEWNAMNIAFLQTHRFFTGYARILWDEQKRKNIEYMLLNMQKH